MGVLKNDVTQVVHDFVTLKALDRRKKEAHSLVRVGFDELDIDLVQNGGRLDIANPVVNFVICHFLIGSIYSFVAKQMVHEG